MSRSPRIAIDVNQRAKVTAWLVAQQAAGKLAEYQLDAIASHATTALGFKVPSRIIGLVCRALGFAYKTHHSHESGTMTKVKRDIEELQKAVTALTTKLDAAVSKLHGRLLFLEKSLGVTAQPT